MLVDINLLPKKEKKRQGGLIFIIILLGVALSLISAGWFYYQSKQQQVEQLNKELASNQQLREVYENAQSTQEISPTEKLKQAVDWAESNRKGTYALLLEITSLLPDRGYIQNYSFESQGVLSINIQFDTTRQAADFLSHMRSSDFIVSVDLNSITANEIGEAESEDNSLPRYLADFSIELNMEALSISELAEEGES